MMSFYEDTNVARSIPARTALYSVSLLNVGKSSYMACSIISPIMALSCKPTLAPFWREASSTLRIHQPTSFCSTSSWGSSAKKYVNICPFNIGQGLY